MENTKDEVFKVFYNSSLNRVEGKRETKKEKILNGIKNHKLITTTVIAFFMFSTINLVMIYSFMKILQNI